MGASFGLVVTELAVYSIRDCGGADKLPSGFRLDQVIMRGSGQVSGLARRRPGTRVSLLHVAQCLPNPRRQSLKPTLQVIDAKPPEAKTLAPCELRSTFT